jgi:hypothetical protein
MSDDINGDVPAFPACTAGQYYAPNGMALRDWFASTAQHEDLVLPDSTYEAAKLLGLEPSEYRKDIHWSQIVAEARYRYAEAMLAERAKK